MKKLIIALAVVLSSAAVVSAHGTKSAGKSSVVVAATHCYVMKDAAMYICDGKALAPMKEDITLSNGTLVSYKGVVKTKAGAVSNLASGQCITVTGVIGDYAKTHMK